MSTPEDIDEAMEQNALGPKSMSQDGASITQQTLQDQIAYANYKAGKTAARNKNFGLRITKLIPPGGG